MVIQRNLSSVPSAAQIISPRGFDVVSVRPEQLEYAVKDPTPELPLVPFCSLNRFVIVSLLSRV
jgi:hypothetical protein